MKPMPVPEPKKPEFFVTEKESPVELSKAEMIAEVVSKNPSSPNKLESPTKPVNALPEAKPVNALSEVKSVEAAPLLPSTDSISSVPEKTSIKPEEPAPKPTSSPLKTSPKKEAPIAPERSKTIAEPKPLYNLPPVKRTKTKLDPDIMLSKQPKAPALEGAESSPEKVAGENREEEVN